MIGLIPRLWMTLLEQQADDAQVPAVLAEAGIPPDRRFALDQPYDDAELLPLVHASAKVLGRDLDALIDDFADLFIADAVRRWPVWFEMAPDARSFLERQPRIHASFARALDTAADRDAPKPQKFHITELDDGLRVEYRSENRLCGLYKSLAAAVLRHYRDESGRIDERVCMHRGHDHCEIRLTWPRADRT